MADVAILASQVQVTPNGYTIPGGQEIVLKSIRVSYDGTSAAGSFVPVLQLVAPGGSATVVAEYPLNSSLAAGASADVTWFPGVTTSTKNIIAAGITQLDYAQRSTDLTVTGSDFPTSNVYIQGNPVTLDGSTRVQIEVYCTVVVVPVNLVISVEEGGVQLARFAQMGATLAPGPYSISVPLFVSAFLTPTAGTHTYSIRAWSPGSGGSTIMQCSPPFTAGWYQIQLAKTV